MYPHDYGNPPYFPWLVVWNIWIIFSIQLGMSSSQLTFTPSFFRGVGQQGTPMTMVTHHIFWIISHPEPSLAMINVNPGLINGLLIRGVLLNSHNLPN